MKRMILAGGTGFLGRILTDWFRSRWEIVLLTRRSTCFRDGVLHVHWDGESLNGWEEYIDGADVVINLTGKSVDCRYNAENMKEILESRINSTRAIGEAIKQSNTPPSLWINAASATIYRHSEDMDMDEESGEFGTGFSVDVCREWEAVFNEAKVNQTRKIAIRTGIVMGREGGPFIPLRRMVRLGLGGRQGNGRQFVSWLHARDFAEVIDFLIQNPSCKGVYNVTAPNPVSNKDFMRVMRKAFRMPIGLPAPKWLLEFGAILIGTETELILKSRRVVPARLLDAGYRFKFSKPEDAMISLAGSG